MKTSLLRDIIRYAKTKGKAPLDERQMDTLKDLYMELAKSVILAFMVFMIIYGYKEMYQKESTFNYMSLAMSLLGAVTYYYLLRSCYQQVIGIDVNFEILVIPALGFTPSLLMNALHVCGLLLDADVLFFRITTFLWPLYFIIFYLGANRVYQRGRQAMEQEIYQGEIHFRSRKQIVNFIIITIIFISILPISFDALFQIGIVAGTLLILFMICYYGFYTPHNEYILNESGLIYHKSLWNGRGGFLRYDEIESVKQQDTFNVGYAKDKVCIHCYVGRDILLFPENAYRFCVELENNL